MRMDRLLSQAAGLTRKQARIEIRKRRVSIDGQCQTDPAAQVADDACLVWDGQEYALVGKLYLMLHKPAGVLSARRDAQQTTVLDLLPVELARRVHVVGRLDKDTTGLLLLSDDGHWSHRVSSPRHGPGKRYRADLAEPLVAEAEQRFAQGLLLRGETRPTRPAQLLRETDTRVRVTLHEGRYHQVRRMFAALGNHVCALHREAIGGLELDPTLAPGGWRALAADEIQGLARASAD